MLHVLTKGGKKLFSGTKHQVKQFLRKNNVKSYVLKEHFVEKVAVTDPIDEFNEVFNFNKKGKGKPDKGDIPDPTNPVGPIFTDE